MNDHSLDNCIVPIHIHPYVKVIGGNADVRVSQWGNRPPLNPTADGKKILA